MNKRNTFLYLKSDNGNFNTDTNFYRFNLVNPIVARPDELINVRASEIEIPVSYYNINNYNNRFYVECTVNPGSNTAVFTQSIPEGNYTARELESQLNEIANVSVTPGTFKIVSLFDAKTSKFNFTISKVSGITCSIDEVRFFKNTAYTNYIDKIVGLTPVVFVSSGESVTRISDKVCDLNRTNNIYLETDLTIESRNSVGERSGILSKIQMSGELFSIVHWQNNTNEDITLSQKDKYIDHINLKLVTEDKEQLINFNGADWTVTLLFSFIKKDPMLLGENIETESINRPILSTINNDVCDLNDEGSLSDYMTDDEKLNIDLMYNDSI